jgi:hypothetical protein
MFAVFWRIIYGLFSSFDPYVYMTSDDDSPYALSFLVMGLYPGTTVILLARIATYPNGA